jgi:hypothetical protein
MIKYLLKNLRQAFSEADYQLTSVVSNNPLRPSPKADPKGRKRAKNKE